MIALRCETVSTNKFKYSIIPWIVDVLGCHVVEMGQSILGMRVFSV